MHVQVALTWRDGSSAAKLTVHRSAAVSEARIALNAWASLTLRLWHGAEDVEVEWTVGPVPIEDGAGKEVMLRLRSDIDSGAASQLLWDTVWHWAVVGASQEAMLRLRSGIDSGAPPQLLWYSVWHWALWQFTGKEVLRQKESGIVLGLDGVVADGCSDGDGQESRLNLRSNTSAQPCR